MKCIVIDDEPLAWKGMEAYIQKVSFMELKGSFSSAVLAGTYLEQHEADVMFLDINMPKITGLDFARSLSNSPLIIFTTAYPQYALDSYDLDTIDYLVKPIGFERFMRAVNKAQHYLKLINSEEKSNEVENIKDDFIFVRADRMFYKGCTTSCQLWGWIKSRTLYHWLLFLATRKLAICCAPCLVHRWPESFKRCWIRWRWAASIAPDPISKPCALKLP